MRDKHLHRLLVAERGQALVTMVVALPVLLGFAGLAIDMGMLRYDRRVQQTAADAAAIAGANELRYNDGLAGITSAAQNASAANSFTKSSTVDSLSGCGPTAAVGTVCVQVNNPPSSGPHTSNTGTCGLTGTGSCYVEVLVAAVQPTYFMKVFGVTRSTVTARAVATLVNQPGDTKPGCVYTLNPPGVGVGLTVGGTATTIASNCGISDDGNFTSSNNTALSAASIGVVGSITGSATCTAISPCPAKQVPVPDPLSYLTPPTGSTIPSCSAPDSHGAWSPSACSADFNNTNGQETKVSCPSGTCKFKSVSITGGTVDFDPGTYIIDSNQGYKITGGTVCNSTNEPPAALCSGMPGNANRGVTFYLTGTSGVSVSGSSTVQLSAPNSCPTGTPQSRCYAAVLFYQDPADTVQATLVGNSASYYQGALYFPGAELDFGGGSGAAVFNQGAAYTTLVSGDLRFIGSSTTYINSNFQGLPNGASIIANAVLVE